MFSATITIYFKRSRIMALEICFYQLLEYDYNNAREKIDSYSLKRLVLNSSVTLVNKISLT